METEAPLNQLSRLTVLSVLGNDRHHHRRLRCRCLCGQIVIARADHVKSGKTVSCGCLRSEVTVSRNLKHGHAKRGHHSAEYDVWWGMQARCFNPNNARYADYGGRGIQVCGRWKDFEAFYTDMGKRPSTAFSIERINNDGNYEPTNCRWATAKEQCANRRKPKW